MLHHYKVTAYAIIIDNGRTEHVILRSQICGQSAILDEEGYRPEELFDGLMNAPISPVQRFRCGKRTHQVGNLLATAFTANLRITSSKVFIQLNDILDDEGQGMRAGKPSLLVLVLPYFFFCCGHRPRHSKWFCSCDIGVPYYTEKNILYFRLKIQMNPITIDCTFAVLTPSRCTTRRYPCYRKALASLCCPVRETEAVLCENTLRAASVYDAARQPSCGNLEPAGGMAERSDRHPTTSCGASQAPATAPAI